MSRLGCYFCFKTLNPQDKQEQFQTFVKCNQCNIVYHILCWEQAHKKCVKCHNVTAEPVEIPPPRPLEVVTKTKPLLIKPSSIITLEDKKLSLWRNWGIAGTIILGLGLWGAINLFSSITTDKAVNGASTTSTTVAISTPTSPLKNSPVTPVLTQSSAVDTLTQKTATPASLANTAALCSKIYSAQPGDSISKIAERFLGNPLAFEVIVKTTQEAHTLDSTFVQLDNPNALEVGDKLCIPFIKAVASPTSAPRPTNTPTVESQPAVTPTIPQLSTAAIPCSRTPRGEFAALWQIHRNRVGCPMETEPLYGKFAEMPFERGHLFWVGDIDQYGELRLVIATMGGQNEGDSGTWLTHQENWNGEGICGSIPSPPQDLYLPDRGLAKVWCEIDGINKLGYATAPKEFVPERGISAIQNFEQAVIFRDSDGYSKQLVYILFRESNKYIRVRY